MQFLNRFGAHRNCLRWHFGEASLPSLTQTQFTYAFADLRCYGASRESDGTFTIDEAAGDAVAIADKLGWIRFPLIGHSMSGLVVQRMLQLVPERVVRVVALTPVPPAGVMLDQSIVDLLRSIALANERDHFSVITGFIKSMKFSHQWCENWMDQDNADVRELIGRLAARLIQQLLPLRCSAR